MNGFAVAAALFAAAWALLRPQRPAAEDQSDDDWDRREVIIRIEPVAAQVAPQPRRQRRRAPATRYAVSAPGTLGTPPAIWTPQAGNGLRPTPKSP